MVFFSTFSRHILAIMSMAICSGVALAQDVIPDPKTIRATSHGKIIGTKADNGADVWRSVPYAASTAGENRWRAPQSAASWDGVRDATTFGERCPQTTNFFNPIEGVENGTLVGSEDCLSLDIYAPENSAGKSLPVMVWIHGGSNVSGSSHIYPGHKLAVNENVIVIGVQYRLGPLGWFSHEAFDKEGANFGTLDLIAALHWVKDNATAFGGDPNLVTVFGESAGGHNVVTLLAAPAAKGLFHRAIIQSGSFDSQSVDDARGNTGSLTNNSATIATKLETNDASELRKFSVAEVFNAYDIGTGFTELPTIIEDGVVLPGGKLREVFSSTDNFNAVPIITGTNRDEMKLFQLGDKRLTRTVFGRLFVARNQKLYDAASDYSSRIWRIRSVDGPAIRMAEGGHDQVYGYRFDWDDGGSFFIMNLGKMLGAAHGMEIPFVFNRFQLLGEADRVLFQEKTLESREKLSRAMGAYWASFARSGVPAVDNEPDWPIYVTGGASLLRFDAVRRKKDRGIEVIKGADNIDRVLRDLKVDKRLNAKRRCDVAKGIANWVPDIAAQVTSSFCGSVKGG